MVMAAVGQSENYAGIERFLFCGCEPRPPFNRTAVDSRFSHCGCGGSWCLLTTEADADGSVEEAERAMVITSAGCIFFMAKTASLGCIGAAGLATERAV